jgi:hypothetical protein
LDYVSSKSLAELAELHAALHAHGLTADEAQKMASTLAQTLHGIDGMSLTSTFLPNTSLKLENFGVFSLLLPRYLPQDGPLRIDDITEGIQKELQMLEDQEPGAEYG